MKTCPKCKTEKEESEYTKDKTRKDGLYPTCKKCFSISKKKSRVKHRESYNRYARKWKKENRNKVNLSYNKWASNNPEKIRSRDANQRKRSCEEVRNSYVRKLLLDEGLTGEFINNNLILIELRKLQVKTKRELKKQSNDNKNQ
jgi:hypothetical protein